MDVLINNEYKGAEDCLGLSKKRKSNNARSQRRMKKRDLEKFPVTATSGKSFNARSKSKDPQSQVKDAPRSQVKDAPRSQVKNAPGIQVKDAPRSQVKDAPRTQLKDAPSYQSNKTACSQSKDLAPSLLMYDTRSVVTEAARSLSMDNAEYLTTDAAGSLSKEGVASLTTEVVVDQNLSHTMDEESIDNQPNMLIHDCHSTKEHFGPTNFRLLQKNKQRNCKDMRKTLAKTKKAKFERSHLCSMLNQEQMVKLRLKGMIFIEVNKPVQKMEGKAEVVFWSLADPSIRLSDLDLSSSDICVIMAYKKIKHDTTLAYIGSIKGRLPDDDEKIILTIIIQSIKKKLGRKVDICNLFETCKEIKLNISKGSSSNHF